MPKFLLTFISILFFALPAYAAPCYGTRMPERNSLFSGFQTHSILKRYLENQQGELRSLQHFWLISYGVFDWLCIDLKGGAGNIKQHPLASDEVDYASSFNGGYGFRLKLYDHKNTKMVFGFQHISVHPRKTHLNGTKHKAVLDDWQVSFLVSQEISKFTPYVGTKWSRVDYIHWVQEDRKRVMSDLTKDIGFVFGLDFDITEKIWLNLEGQFFDTEAVALSVNFSF
jgi:hypothetical protein